MSALAVMEMPSSGATLSPDVPERLNLLEACQLISEKLIERGGKAINYSRFRAMWAKDHPAILPMKRAKGTEKTHGDWRIPVRAALRSADMWPRDWRGPEPLPADVQDLILHLRQDEHLSYQAIADELQRRGIPTRRGHERWEAKTVHWVVTRALREQGDQHGDEDGNPT